MDQHEDHDPFAGLEDWAKKTERRVRREVRGRGFRQMRARLPERAARYLRLAMAFVIAGVLLAATIPVLRSWMPATGPAPYPTQTATAGATASAGEAATASATADEAATPGETHWPPGSGPPPTSTPPTSPG